ncbi:MAG: hypothetical protein U0573_05935 [Phycisphaerales bacterium]|nr:hypothetical protein [Planctomycetota bacterium]
MKSPPNPAPAGLDELRRLCRQDPAEVSVLPTGLGIDPDLPHAGLLRGRVHEWLGLESSDTAGPNPGRFWSPPSTLLVHLAQAALHQADNAQARLVWVGREIWPYPSVLAAPQGNDPLSCSLFVDATSPAQRLWAVDLALRSRAAIAVIANGAELDLASTRRLQLAAEASGAICFLARPPWERSVLSASATRWLVQTAPSPNRARRWTVSLLRCKGSHEATRLWTLERDHATRSFALVPNLRDRSGQATPAPIRLVG